MRSVSALFALALLGTPATLTGQVLLAPEPQPKNQNVKCREFPNPSTPLTELRDHYTAGRWDRLQADTRALLNSCAFAPEPADQALFQTGTGPAGGTYRPDYERDWYLVVLATVDRDDQPLVIRYVVHDPVPYPYSTATLGVPAEPRDRPGSRINEPATPRLVQVFLAPNRALSLETKIQVTEMANPVQEQVADVVKAVLDPSVIVPLLKGIVTPATDAAAAAAAAPSPVLATVSRVYPPFERADYKYSDVLRAPAMLDGDKSLLLREKFEGLSEAALKAAEAAEKTAADLTKAELEIRNSPTASPQEKARAVARRDTAIAAAAVRVHELELARALSAAAATYIVEHSSKDCSPALYRETCWIGLEAELNAAALTYCHGNPAFCSSGERDELMRLHFVEAGKPAKTATASSSTTLASIPYQQLSFGTLGAYIGGASAAKDRVKIDGGKVVADPIGRAMTAVVLNIHPRFNPKAPRMERAERLRAFAGAILTPNLGMAVGAGYGLLRNLSVNAGYGVLMIPTRRGIDHLNEPPSDGRQPFRTGAAHVWFLGLGYKFGK